MYYYSKNIVFIFEDREVRDEVDRQLSKDDMEFFHYISELVEKDISNKLGKKIYEKSDIVESDVKDLVKQDNNDQLSAIMNKLDFFMANFMANGSNAQNPGSFQGNNPIANSNTFVNPSIQSNYDQQTNHNQNESLAIDVSSEAVAKEVPVKEAFTSAEKPKTVKKKSTGLKGKNKSSILSKMQSMKK